MINIYCYITALKKETDVDVEHNIHENLNKIGFLNLNTVSSTLKQFKKQS